tara:strand:+ start:566 stop:1126 length:561 start_codon:yes stop_codon:yes gene_type:complete
MIWIILIAVLIGLYLLYYALISRRNKVLEALSGIDVQLKKRHDLLPNVLSIAKKYMEHERDVLNRVTEMRSRADQSYDRRKPEEVERHLEAEKGLQAAMMQLFAVAENYPDLKAHQTMIQAQQSFEEVEGHIAAARRFYNSAVTDLNNLVQIFPTSVIAGLIGIKSMPYLEAEETERKPVVATDYL